jgi:hypothetical protein
MKIRNWKVMGLPFVLALGGCAVDTGEELGETEQAMQSGKSVYQVGAALTGPLATAEPDIEGVTRFEIVPSVVKLVSMDGGRTRFSKSSTGTSSTSLELTTEGKSGCLQAFAHQVSTGYRQAISIPMMASGDTLDPCTGTVPVGPILDIAAGEAPPAAYRTRRRYMCYDGKCGWWTVKRSEGIP